MTKFEYVSVGIALVYSFAVARVVSALPAVLAPGRRYWVHGSWAAVLLLAAVVTWWNFWEIREVEWTPIRFAWVLTVPALIHARAGVLVSERPGAVACWRTHYFETRVPFFLIGMIIGANGIQLPWILGTASWFALVPDHAGWAALLVISGLGLLSPKPLLHGFIVVLNLLLILGTMVLRSLAI